MKKIRIKIANYDPTDTCSYGYFIINILKKHYEIELCEDPDYLFFNESQSDFLNYPRAIKIFYTGENMHADFNICDYGFGFDYLNFGDRYYRLPIYIVSKFYRPKELSQEQNLQQIGIETEGYFDVEMLRKKDGFCSFVYSNYLADSQRKDFFDKLSLYKKVNSGGAYLNNIGGRTDNKLAFEMRHKFSIAFENSSNDGYTTEKLPNALAAQTIPIYWGNPLVDKEFNTKRFINCHNFADFDAVVERVKEIDLDDNLYIEMINQPQYAEGYNPDEVKAGFEKFLLHIFEQPIDEARRIRINTARQSDMLKNLKVMRKVINARNSALKLASLLYRPFKKIGVIESFKKQYLAKRKLGK